jgi:fused signal recognition particle receptor
VIFDAMEAAKARDVDLLIADTAGRLHTQSNLMAELQKVKRVLSKIDANAPHEVLIVLDATLGQNALNQVKQFNEAIGITGIALTKLDGTAKGGIIFAIAKATRIPIRYIGVGEGIDDLRPFNADEFVEALLG